MTTSQIFKFVNSQKTQKSKYLENEILLHRQIKKTYSLYIKDYNMEEDHNYRGHKIHILLLQPLSIILGVNGGCVCLHISRSRIYLCCNWISYRSELLLVNYVLNTLLIGTLIIVLFMDLCWTKIKKHRNLYALQCLIINPSLTVGSSLSIYVVIHFFKFSSFLASLHFLIKKGTFLICIFTQVKA